MSITTRTSTDALDAAGQDHPELQKAIEEIVDSGFTGITLRVHDERGEWVGSAGAAELGGTAEPPINGHVRIGSNTKTFTATLVLQLVAEGKIGLDTPVAGYLPEFGLDERITVRMLLQHTSGLFNFTGEVYDDGTIVHGIPVPYSTTGKEWVDNRIDVERTVYGGWSVITVDNNNPTYTRTPSGSFSWTVDESLASLKGKLHRWQLDSVRRRMSRQCRDRST